MPKKIFFLFLFCLMFAAPALASGSVTVFTVGAHTYTVDGRVQDIDVAPFTSGGRVFLPVRYVAEALGVSPGNITYRGGVITLSRGGTVVRLTVGGNVMLVNGNAVTMDVKVTTVDGRAVLPAAWVCRAFGTVPVWNGAARTVTIEEPDGSAGDGSVDLSDTGGGGGPVAVTPYDAGGDFPNPAVEVLPALAYPSSVATVSRDYRWQYNGVTYRWHVQVPADLLDWDRKVAGMVNTFYNSDGLTQGVMFSSLPDDLQQLVASCSDEANGDYTPWVEESLNYTYAGLLAKWLSARAQADGYDYFHTAEFVQSFVGGAIPYNLTPVPRLAAQTLIDSGDCKDKSILLAAILKNMGYHVALLFYPPPPGETTGHMAVGIAFSAGQITTARELSYYPYDGEKYYFAETTAPDWLIGQISDESLEKSGYVYPVP